MKFQEVHGSNARTMKDRNTRVVLEALRARKMGTVRFLAEQTGLSAVTVGSIIQELIHEGRVLPGELAPSEGGRPAQQFIFNGHFQHGLAVFSRELGGVDTLCFRVVDLLGGVVGRRDVPLGQITPENLEEQVAIILDEDPSIGALGFGVPGIELGGTIVALDYPAFREVNLVERLTGRFARPVRVENDVNAAALGRGIQADPRHSEVCIYFPRKYPPGAGIRVDGRLIKGARHFAGEVAWLPLGIAWGPELADSRDDFIAAAARVVVSLVAVVDPQSVVLYGEFLTPDYREGIIARCRKLLPRDMELPEILCPGDFSGDFEQGLIGITLELLDNPK